MDRRTVGYWGRVLVASLLPLALLGCSFVGPGGVFAEERLAPAEPLASLRLDTLEGYAPSGSLGFRLRETPITEQVYRRVQGDERGLIWVAQFTSRWPLTEDQLDRWSAQAIGHLADGLGPNVRLAGWEQLASDVGDQRVAYRYRLATASGAPLGEATIIVFARGNQVGISGTAAIGTRVPVDAAALARALDAATRG
jgi:hypothetical protein